MPTSLWVKEPKVATHVNSAADTRSQHTPWGNGNGKQEAAAHATNFQQLVAAYTREGAYQNAAACQRANFERRILLAAPQGVWEANAC